LSGIKDINTYSQGVIGLSPSCIAIDENKDFWVTLYDASLVVKFDGNNHDVIDMIQNTDNQTYSDAQTGTSGFLNLGQGGFNTIEPGIVDTDTKNNIWVAYTNPLSSSIRKYNSNGEHLTTIQFDEGMSPNDIVVDADDNVWVAIVNRFREPRETLNTTVSAYVDNGVFRYYSETALSSWK